MPDGTARPKDVPSLKWDAHIQALREQWPDLSDQEFAHKVVASFGINHAQTTSTPAIQPLAVFLCEEKSRSGRENLVTIVLATTEAEARAIIASDNEDQAKVTRLANCDEPKVLTVLLGHRLNLVQ